MLKINDGLYVNENMAETLEVVPNQARDGFTIRIIFPSGLKYDHNRFENKETAIEYLRTLGNGGLVVKEPTKVATEVKSVSRKGKAPQSAV